MANVKFNTDAHSNFLIKMILMIPIFSNQKETNKNQSFKSEIPWHCLLITASCAITSTEPTLSDNNLNSCYNLPATSPRELEVSFILETREHCHRKSKIQVLLHTGSSLINKTCESLGRMFFSQVDGCNGKRFQAREVVDPETPGTDGKCTIECSCGAEDCRVTFFRGPMIPTVPGLKFCEAYIVYQWKQFDVLSKL